jgi:hypothetical protein
MTRYIVVWHPAFEAGKSRMEIVNSLKDSWIRTGNPQMAERRKLELKVTLHQGVFDRVNEWLSKTWGKSMSKRALSIVLISDPVWEETPERWTTAHAALSGGYSASGEKPQFCILAYEGDLQAVPT